MGKKTIKNNSVRTILLKGVFWRILFIEGVLLVYSLFYRWVAEDAGMADLFWYAVRIMLLVVIIIAFMMVTLKRFLTHKIIAPLEAIARANREIEADFSRDPGITLKEKPPDEIAGIVSSRTSMLNRIIAVSNQRLKLVDLVKKTFGRYLSEKVVDQILSSPQGQELGGSRRTVTVLMSDLRGFTSLSESRDPRQMVQLLNQYLERMSTIILRHDGIIDEIIGDAVLAVFGAPDPHDNDPERAVVCAVEMQNSLADLNSKLADQGFLPLEMGIGINTGEVILGNIGSPLRMKYGIVGDTVNRASRIEANSLGGQVLLGETTYREVASLVTAGPAKTKMMKGMKKPLVFYSVTAITTRGRDLRVLVSLPRQNGLEISLPFQCWIVRNKAIDPVSLFGETVSMDDHRMEVVTSRSLDPFTDVKIQFDFCLEAHCFEAIYAKCTECQAGGEKNRCKLRITAMEEKDRAIVKQWMAEATVG
ncbi:MAG: adenylate/guanylate cyclase domain-containing protein [Desulfobacteraceae bacterium]